MGPRRAWFAVLLLSSTSTLLQQHVGALKAGGGGVLCGWVVGYAAWDASVVCVLWVGAVVGCVV